LVEYFQSTLQREQKKRGREVRKDGLLRNDKDLILQAYETMSQSGQSSQYFNSLGVIYSQASTHLTRICLSKEESLHAGV